MLRKHNLQAQHRGRFIVAAAGTGWPDARFFGIAAAVPVC